MEEIAYSQSVSFTPEEQIAQLKAQFTDWAIALVQDYAETTEIDKVAIRQNAELELQTILEKVP